MVGVFDSFSCIIVFEMDMVFMFEVDLVIIRGVLFLFLGVLLLDFLMMNVVVGLFGRGDCLWWFFS